MDVQQIGKGTRLAMNLFLVGLRQNKFPELLQAAEPRTVKTDQPLTQPEKVLLNPLDEATRRGRPINQLGSSTKKGVSSKMSVSHHEETSNSSKDGISINSGRWEKEEHNLFLEALSLYGRSWKLVKRHVRTRTSTQARSHAQKFFSKLKKKNITLEEFLKSKNLATDKIDFRIEDELGETLPENKIGTKRNQPSPLPNRQEVQKEEASAQKRQKTLGPDMKKTIEYLKQNNPQPSVGQPLA